MYHHLPLAQRIARTHSKPQTSLLPTAGPRGSYRSWEDTALASAMESVGRGLSLRRAAEMYGVPKSTLHDHMSGKIALGAHPGQDPYLSTEEEELASFLVQTAKIGYPHTKSQVLALVQQMVNEKGIDANVSNG